MTREREGRGGKTSAKSWSNRQQSGFENESFRLPEGVELFKVDSDKPRRLDFLCWKAGKGNPNWEEGERCFELSYWVHRIGPDNRRYVCPNKSRGKPCPVCEHRAKLRLDPDADEDLVKSLRPSQRQLWLVYDLEDMNRGVQLVDYSYYHLGEKIKAEIDNADEDDGFEYFADLEDGLTAKILFEEEKPYGFRAASVSFKKRAKQYGYGKADDLPVVEDLLKVLPYDELRKVFLQIDDEGDEHPPTKAPERKERSEKPSGGKAKPAMAEEKTPTADDAGIEVGTKVRHRKMGLCTVVKVSPDGTSLTLEDEDGDRAKAIGVDEVRVVEDEPEPEEPKRKPREEPKPEKRKVKEPEPEPQDEDEDGWDDEPAPPKKPSGKQPKREEPKDEDDGWGDDDDPPAKPEKRKPTKEAKKPAPADDDWD